VGIVWEAEHLETNRRVALKVTGIEHALDERHRRTFQRETQALARLEHPNIAALLDSGQTEDGHDFFSKEIVQGPTLDRWIAGRPPELDADELDRRLCLFSTICDTVHNACRGLASRRKQRNQ
jgi:serine/threonine protein kinase